MNTNMEMRVEFIKQQQQITQRQMTDVGIRKHLHTNTSIQYEDGMMHF